VVRGRTALVGLVLSLATACSSVLGYDEVTFDEGTGGAQGGSGAAAGAGGATTGGSGGAGVGGSGVGGSGVGGSGGAGVGGSGGAATGGSGGGVGGGATGGAGGGGGDPLESYRQACVDQINAYRATLSLPPYQRWTSAEACVDGEAKSDSETGEPHGSFGACGEFAQNECPGYGSLDATVTTCLAQMWAEGPGADFQQHGHYINMSSTSYSMVACGFYVTPSGDVWAAQDFK
jgi:hypothetical protein